MFEVNNRIIISGVGIGSVLLLIILLIMGIITHHVFVKKPNRVIKRENRSQIEGRIIGLEGIMRERGYFLICVNNCDYVTLMHLEKFLQKSKN